MSVDDFEPLFGLIAPNTSTQESNRALQKDLTTESSAAPRHNRSSDSWSTTLASQPSLLPSSIPRTSESHTSNTYRPSGSMLMNRVKEAKQIGKTIDELIHELQNEFYPLNPLPGYVTPPPNLYRVTVRRLERWNDILDDPNPPVAEAVFLPKNTSKTVFSLFLSTLCRGKRKRAQEVHDDLEEESSRSACRKRSRSS